MPNDTECVPMREVHYEARCGCWCSRLYHPDGELLELRLQVCEDCMSKFHEALVLQIASETEQLTLPLPSPEGDRGRDASNA